MVNTGTATPIKGPLTTDPESWHLLNLLSQRFRLNRIDHCLQCGWKCCAAPASVRKCLAAHVEVFLLFLSTGEFAIPWEVLLAAMDLSVFIYYRSLLLQCVVDWKMSYTRFKIFNEFAIMTMFLQRRHSPPSAQPGRSISSSDSCSSVARCAANMLIKLNLSFLKNNTSKLLLVLWLRLGQRTLIVLASCWIYTTT